MKNKILFLGRFPPPMNGASRMNEIYFKSKILRENFEIRKIKINSSNSMSDINAIGFKKIVKPIEVFLRLFYGLIFFHPKIVYFEICTKGVGFIRDSLFVWVCKLFKTKIIFHSHMRDIEKSKYSKLVFKNTKVILLSKLLYPYVKEVISKKNISYLPNGIENEITDKEFKQITKLKKQNKKQTFLFFSNMIKSKGPLEVLDICNILNKDKKDFECLFVGAWLDENIKQKWFETVKKFKLEKKCKYLGPKYKEEKRKIFEKANLLIFPTKYEFECFPLVILEAFMFGIPVLTYNTGAIKEVVSRNFLGFIGNTPQELAKEIKKRLKKKPESTKIRKYFKENYLNQTAEKKLLNIFEQEIK